MFQLGKRHDEAEVTRMFHKIDGSGNGQLDEAEFVTFMEEEERAHHTVGHKFT